MSTQTPLTRFIGDRSPRILVVDDEPLNLQLLKGYLTRWGCIVEISTSGARVKAMVRKFAPDLILLDVLMPDRSGFAVCEALSEDSATASIPVIFISATSEAEAKLVGFATGGCDYLTKPFDPADLAARMGVLLRQKYATDARREGPAELSAHVHE